MPAVLRIGPYRFYFYSHEGSQPPHVNVDRENRSAKFWLRPPALARNLGFGAYELRKLQSLVDKHQRWTSTRESLWRPGMGILALAADERVATVEVGDDALSVTLMDGRTITVPLAWYPRLLHASPTQRAHWRISGGGYGIHWPELDEDLSTEGLLQGAPAPRNPPPKSRKRQAKR